MEKIAFYKNNVLIYSKDKEIFEIVKRITKSLNLNLMVAEDVIDLFAIGAFILIVDSKEVDTNFIDNFREVFDLENPKEFAIILTSPIKIPRDIKKFFIYLNSTNNLESQIRTTILSRKTNFINHKNNKKDYTKKLNRLFVILNYLKIDGNYIKIPELTEEFGVSEKTIKRDLQFLREVGGEDIRYDTTKKGYYLDNSFLSNISNKL